MTLWIILFRREGFSLEAKFFRGLCQKGLWFEIGRGGAICCAPSNSLTDGVSTYFASLEITVAAFVGVSERHRLDSLKFRWNVKIKEDLTVSQDSKTIHGPLSDLLSVWLTSRKRISMGTDKCLLFMPWTTQLSPQSLTNLALYLGGCKQPLSFHVQPNYLPEFLFKSRERKKKKKGSFFSPPPSCMELITVFSSGRVGKKTHWAEMAHKTTAGMLYLPVVY